MPHTLTAVFRRVAVDLSPLRHVDYRRLWAGNAIAFLGFQITAVAVPVQVYDITRSSFWVGMLGAVGLVPLVVFGLWGGAIADSYDRRRVLLTDRWSLWASTAGPARALAAGRREPAGAARPGRGAVGRLRGGGVHPRRDHPAGARPRSGPPRNTLGFTTSNVSMLAGPLLAALIITQWSLSVAYGGRGAVRGGALRRGPPSPLPPLGATPPRAAVGRRRPGVHRDPAGAAALLRRRHRRDGVRDAARAVPGRAEELGGDAAVGWLFAALALGAVSPGRPPAGSGGCAGRASRWCFAIVIWGWPWPAPASRTSCGWRSLLLALGGAADLVSAVYRQTILQTYAPDEMRGRMQGVFIVVVAGGPRLGDVRAGASAAVWGPTAAWVGGIACVVVVGVLATLQPALIRYRRPADVDAGDPATAENAVDGSAANP